MSGAGVEWDAAAYDRLSDPQFAWGRVVLERLPLAGGETVIDAGCGSGRLTELLLERLPAGAVVAIDQAEGMLRQARLRLEPRFGGRVRYLRADLARLALEGEADAVFSTATFHWVLDHDALFASLFRALRPGGLLVAQCGGGDNLAGLFGRAARVVDERVLSRYFEGWRRPVRFEAPGPTAARLRAAGFVEVETGLEAAPTVLPDADTYRAYLRTVVMRPHLERLPSPELQAALLDPLVAAAAGDDPPFSLDYRRLNLRGRRPR